MMTILIITSGILLYTYIGYPLLLWLLSKLVNRPWLRDERYKPMVNVILPVYNEEIVLRKCVQSLLSQDYPKEKLQILIGSDASTDRTNEILGELASMHSQVVPHLFAQNRGKAAVLADLAKSASGEILFFVDADVLLHRNCISAHMANYVDREVGAVTGHLAFSRDGEAGAYASETRYWSVESWIRRLESEIKSTASMYGGNYSMRTTLFHMPVESPLSDDLYTSLLTLKLGRRIIFDPDAICTETYMRSVADEFKRKTRNSSMGLAAMQKFWTLLLPWSGWPAFTLWPHKLLRWLTPFLLAIAFGCSLVLMIQQATTGYILSSLFIAGILFGVGGWFLSTRETPKQWPVFSQAYWILMMNAAFLTGIKKFVLKRDSASWSPVRRVQSAEDTSNL